jgi:hypothetical protein
MSRITYEHTDESLIHKGFEALVEELVRLRTSTVEVGVLSDKNTRTSDRHYDGKTLSPLGPPESNNATVGFNMEFGNASDGADRVPARSFLREPLINHLSDALTSGGVAWEQGAGKAPNAESGTAVIGNPADALGTLPERIGQTAEAVIKEAFNTSGFGQWPQNAPGTIAAKGKDEPGVDTGQLRDSISYRIT